MAYIIRVTCRDTVWVGSSRHVMFITSIYKRTLFRIDKLLYRYVVGPIEVEIPGLNRGKHAAIDQWDSIFEHRTVFRFLYNYKQKV